MSRLLWVALEQGQCTETQPEIINVDKAPHVGGFVRRGREGAGLAVWYDEFELRTGDSLRRKIDGGIARSRFGVVVLSQAFFGRG
ncbi:toll/interleukin-1 receptor domain-containing protein [Dongia sp.]|uniref:toll/interleukin-1 receptor domain-containing protein n=1 Tax=Dongia sp. TaxID=1977262 RepID=UPI0035B102BA